MRVHVAPFRHAVSAYKAPLLSPSTVMFAVLPVTVQSVQSRGKYAPPPSESSITPIQPSSLGLVTCTPSNVA